MTNHDRTLLIIAKHLGILVSDIKPEQDLQDDLGADSLDVIEIVVTLEEEFELWISDEDGESLKTVADVLALVDRLVAAK